MNYLSVCSGVEAATVAWHHLGWKPVGFSEIEPFIRRLMPVETERLQGFPDNYTNISWRNKIHSPDSLRYKAMGNSMAVPVMRWIGERINNINKES